MTGTDRDYTDLLQQGDVALRFWLPELIGRVLDEMCTELNTTRSDLIRQTLFTYLYGRYDLLVMKRKDEKSYQLNPPYSYSAREPDIRSNMDNKNIEDLKVWIPDRMKVDLQKIAEPAGLSLSETIREIIISSLIGHTNLPSRKEMLQLKVELSDESPSA